MRVIYFLLGAWVFIFLGVVDTVAQLGESNNSFWNRSKMTGDWGGTRSELTEDGVTLESVVVGDVMGNIRGGNEQRAFLLENIELSAAFDLEKLLGWNGSGIHISALQNNGVLPTKFVGDLQAANNIEAAQTVKLYEAWIQQNLWRSRISVLAGVYDINFEFDYIDSAQLFLNSSHGMGAELAASGRSGPPTFPATAPSLRLKLLPHSSWSVKAAVSDGAPGSRHVNWDLRRGNGSFWIGEMGYLLSDESASGFDSRLHISRSKTTNYLLKIGVGGWFYSRNFAQQRSGADVGSSEKESGAYFLIDVASLGWINQSLDSASWYVRTGLADDKLSQVRFYLGSGIIFKGILPGCEKDAMGISVARAQNSSVYSNQVLNQESQVSETAFELTYRMPLTPWMDLQPNMQYIINPGTDINNPSALLIGLRTLLNL
jgi:porin